jgi:adenosylmethionine-8-amino-7-oxononanoate aminotransferase
VTRYAREAGVIVVAGIGCADGVAGDTLCLSPPYVITEDEIEEIATVLEAALDRAYAELSA